MQVMCICSNGWAQFYKSGKLYKEFDGPKYAEICTVVEETPDKQSYILSEYPLPEGMGYDKSKFILLSDKDETSYADEVLEEMFVPVEKPVKSLI